MNGNRIPIFTVIVLLVLLAVLATLQYRWLGQISEIESVRLSKRLADDTRRFAAEFNGEIQKAYFNFRVDGGLMESGDYSGFQKRFQLWKQRARFPGLVRDTYYVRSGQIEKISRFEVNAAEFKPADWPARLEGVKKTLDSWDGRSRVVNDSLILPLYRKGPEITKLIVTRKRGMEDQVDQEQRMTIPQNEGFLVIELDRSVISRELLPALRRKYFAQDGGGEFDVSVIDQQGKPVYTTTTGHFETGDASSGLLSLDPGEFAFFTRELGSPLEGEQEVTEEGVVVNNTFARRTVRKIGDEVVSVDLRETESDNSLSPDGNPGPPVSRGAWKMFVRHSSGSLENFVATARYTNLAISFGILGVLAAGMVLILILTQRARALAERQLEFVSSVSHEFRTPLAVIFAAGENISDGVVGTSEKLAEYGGLIKKEGRKLSAMVEQILAFAGANSGKRKYEFKSVEISKLIDDVLDEYQPLIRENGFVLERDIAPGLPPMSADPDAIRQALRNLVANALKYSNGEKWIRVAAESAGDEIIVTVSDRGIGIAKDDQRRIFEPFFRAKSVVEEQISGSGLGLSLVKQIVDAHGGSVLVSSEPGNGTKFTVVLPAGTVI